ncbi:MAG: ATP-binding cassette domain-containing protein [Breznakibacter sp.]
MLSVSDLRFSYDRGSTFSFPDFACAPHEHWLVRGVSGCGKTTLVHLLAGLLTPLQGNIWINGTDITKLATAKADRFRGKEVGIVFQRHHFIQSLTVVENLEVCRFLNGLSMPRRKALDLLERLDIAHKADTRPGQLSQGEQQRLSIARAIINKPSVILADEPTSSLDDENCREALQLLKREAKNNGSVLLVVTHDQRLLPHFNHLLELSRQP